MDLTGEGGISLIGRICRRAVPAAGPLIFGLVGTLTVFAAWHIAVATGLLLELSVPRPLDALARIGDLLQDSNFLAAVQDTMWTWLAAILLTSAIAVPTGVLFGYFSFIYRSSSSLVNAGRSIPSTALIPIGILFFGLGFQMKLAIVSYAIFWPILINTSYGVRHVDRVMLQVGKSFRWSTLKTLLRIVLPAATPYAATGIRLAGGIGFVVVLSAELLGASSGIGTVVRDYQQAERPDFVFGSILIIGMIGIIVYYGLRAVEARMFPWANMNRGEG